MRFEKKTILLPERIQKCIFVAEMHLNWKRDMHLIDPCGTVFTTSAHTTTRTTALCCWLPAMPFRATLRQLQWSGLHMLTGDDVMGWGSRSSKALKRGGGGRIVHLLDFLGSIAKFVDVSMAPVGLKLAAGSTMFALLHWDFANQQWVACTDSFGRDSEIGGGGQGNAGDGGGA